MQIALSGRVRQTTPISRPIGGFRKRAIDVVIAASALIIFLPLLCMIAALIKVFDQGPIFISHERVGASGRMFGCLKFRTMIVDADAILERHLREVPAAAQEWTNTHKLKFDPRVTAVGAVLRKTSIDELPQLINVLRGDMSIVGPRPIVVDEIVKYGSDFGFYLRARPGVTGPWQVGGRNDETYDNRVRLDRAYVESWSFRRDLVLILRTVPAVLSARGCY